MPELDVPEWVPMAQREWDRISPGEDEPESDELADYLFNLGVLLMEVSRG